MIKDDQSHTDDLGDPTIYTDLINEFPYGTDRLILSAETYLKESSPEDRIVIDLPIGSVSLDSLPLVIIGVLNVSIKLKILISHIFEIDE